MASFYLGCLIFGVLFSFVAVFLGDILSTALDGMLDFLSADYLNPTTLATGITVLGGAGLLFTWNSEFGAALALICSLLIAILAAILIHFFYVKPMMNSENSTGYSTKGLTGRLGEVITTIPPVGYGEVLVRVGAGNTNQIAASFENQSIQAGERVVVIEVRDGTLYVSRFENISKGD